MSLVIVLVILLALGGVILLVTGLFPKRTGDTPYCRKCGYNLTGIERDAAGARCSECGAWLAQCGAVVVGQRRVRRARVSVGAVCLLVGGAALGTLAVGTLRGVDWYRFKPTGWVLSDLERGGPRLAQRALMEIARRRSAGRLSPSNTQRLIEVCLREQERTAVRAGITQELVDLLGSFHTSGTLTPEQSARFLTNAVQIVGVRARPTVIAGRQCPFLIDQRTRLPSQGFSGWTVVPRVRFGDRLVYEGCGGGGHAACSDHSAMGWSVQLEQVGQHELAIEAEVLVHPGIATPFDDAEPLHSRTVTLTAPIEVLATEPPDYIKLTHSPKLDQAVAACVTAEDFRVHAVANNGKVWLWITVQLHFGTYRPIGLAFDVTAEFDGHVVSLGRAYASRSALSGKQHYVLLKGELWTPPPDEITIVLRSSTEVALKTVDLYEIWDGELRFEGVTLGAPDVGNWAAMQKVYRPKLVRRGPRPAEMDTGAGPAAASQPAEP